jgi:AcrR family transcriptional regulator
MNEVPNRRRYNAPHRTAKAAATRRAILDAARKLFVAKGITETTVAAIAAEAGVSAPMVYASFRSKAGLLVALLDDLERIVGAAEYADTIEAATRADDKLQLIVGFHCDLFEGALDVIAVAHHSSADPVVRAFVDEGEGRRRRACEQWVRGFQDMGALRPGLHPSTAVDVLWVHTGFELYAAFVLGCGWPRTRVEGWLVATLGTLLFGRRASETARR